MIGLMYPVVDPGSRMVKHCQRTISRTPSYRPITLQSQLWKSLNSFTRVTQERLKMINVINHTKLIYQSLTLIGPRLHVYSLISKHHRWCTTYREWMVLQLRGRAWCRFLVDIIMYLSKVHGVTHHVIAWYLHHPFLSILSWYHLHTMEACHPGTTATSQTCENYNLNTSPETLIKAKEVSILADLWDIGPSPHTWTKHAKICLKW